MGFAYTKLSSEIIVSMKYLSAGIREWSRDLQELAEAWVLERGRSVGNLVAFLFAVICGHYLLLSGKFCFVLPCFETPRSLRFLVSKETVVLRRWESETKFWFYQTS